VRPTRDCGWRCLWATASNGPIFAGSIFCFAQRNWGYRQQCSARLQLLALWLRPCVGALPAGAPTQGYPPVFASPWAVVLLWGGGWAVVQSA
jgi:hypothetical protein